MRRLPLLSIFLVTTSGLGIAMPTVAEVIQIPLAQQGDNKLPRPGKGMTKAEVEKLFGAPESSQGPVGQPPITRWQYPEFVVMFEYDHVVHTVLKHKPKAPIDTLESAPLESTPANEQP